MNPESEKNKTRAKRIAVRALLPLILLAVVAGFVVYSKISKPYEYERVRLFVDADGGVEAFRDSLVATLGKEYGSAVFDIWNRIADPDKLASGSYVVNSGDRAFALARRIRNRMQDPVRVTFNNVRTLDDLSRRLDAQLHLSAAEFLSAADSVLAARNVDRPNRAAYFMPDTYEFYWNASPTQVVDKLVGQYDRFWTDERLKKAAKIGLTPEQVATLASIVEEETAMSDERPTVARLYLNRLGRGMLMQADPTVKFAVGDFSLRRITARHLAVDSPYNTYRYGGLPPGPIRIPAARTLDAVLDASPNSYIYMCAKEDFSGYHNFTADYQQHLNNARRYQQALNRRGIK